MKEAMLYEKLPENEVQCRLCSHRCRIKEGRRGFCQVRENHQGTLYSLVYGKAISAAVDPIEKKPLYHFLPGSLSFSIATVGCNFRCEHCQNFSISQMVHDHQRIAGDDFPPQQVVEQAQRYNCRSISYTYTEPTIFFEYAYDTCRLARDAGLTNVFVSNGFQTPETIETIAPYLDAINIDLKSFSGDFYKKVCNARLEPVLESIRLFWEKGVWVEVTTLIIPRHNDSAEELNETARFLAGVSPDLVWHLSAYHPNYKLTDQPRTPTKILEQAYEIGKKAGLNYVYLGNVISPKGRDTFCKNCGKLIIRRSGMSLAAMEMSGSRCKFCGAKQAGRFE